MLYNYSQYIKILDKNPKTKKLLEKYIHYYGRQDNLNIYETEFYKKYLVKFRIPFFLAHPEDLEDDYDWNLLVKAMVGSLSSEYKLVLDEGWKQKPKGVPRVHLYIIVQDKNQCIIKDIEDLWSFQILRLFEIYTEEQMGLFSLIAEEMEKVLNDRLSSEGMENVANIKSRQEYRLKVFHKKVNLLMKEAHSIKNKSKYLTKKSRYAFRKKHWQRKTLGHTTCQ